MLKRLSRFTKGVARSRIGQLFCVLHLVVLLLVFANRPSAPRDVTNKQSPSGSLLIAGRGFHYHYEPASVKVLIWLDSPGLLFSFVLALLLLPVSLIIPEPGAYDASWVIAVIFLVGTSMQWLFIGYCVSRQLRAFANRDLGTNVDMTNDGNL